MARHRRACRRVLGRASAGAGGGGAACPPPPCLGWGGGGWNRLHNLPERSGPAVAGTHPMSGSTHAHLEHCLERAGLSRPGSLHWAPQPAGLAPSTARCWVPCNSVMERVHSAQSLNGDSCSQSCTRSRSPREHVLTPSEPCPLLGASLECWELGTWTCCQEGPPPRSRPRPVRGCWQPWCCPFSERLRELCLVQW